MSRYEQELERITYQRGKGAESDVKHLYDILVNEDKKSPEEARKILEHDLGGIYAKRTILEFLPAETKDEKKVKAGQTEKKKIIIDTSGNPAAESAAQSSPVGGKEPDSRTSDVSEKLKAIDAPEEWIPNEEDADFLRKRLTKALDDQKALELENERLKEERTQLAQVVKKESFKPASEVEGEKVVLTIDTIKVDQFKNVPIGALLPRVQAPLRNRGWKVFDVIVVDKS